MLKVDGVTVQLGSRALLDDVSVELASGEALAVLGENGAGKSTLLRLMAGDGVPHAARLTGDVWLNGRPMRQWSLAERAQMRAVLPQRPELAFSFSAREVAAFGRYPSSGGWLAVDDYSIADAALRLTDAAHLAHRDVTTLSGGEQARVHLAAVFAQLWEQSAPWPRYLLLDEPTAALDLAHQHHLLATAREFAQQRGIGIVAILHDLNLAAMYADRVLILLHGAALVQGAPAEVLQPATITDGFGVAARVLAHPLAASALIATAAQRGQGPALRVLSEGRGGL